MSLLNEIDANRLRILSGSSANKSTSSNLPSPSGKGSISLNGSGAADVSSGLSRLATAFKGSVIRITKPLGNFQDARDTVNTLLKLTDSLIGLSKRSAQVETTDDQRGSLQTQFNHDVQQIRSILANTSKDGFDFRSKTDLQNALQTAGIDPSHASTLSSAFSRLAASDGEIGFSRIKGEDVAVSTINGTTQVFHASGSTDPLAQDITSQGGGQEAYDTLTKLKTDLQGDSKNLNTVINELVAAGNFAIAGANESAALGSTTAGSLSAEEIAQRLVSYIKTQTRDPLVASHSDLDRTLVGAVLSDPNA